MFAVAFNRDRDSYQLALALQEAGALDALVTDIYLPDALAGSALAKAIGIGHRYCSGISSSQVIMCWRAVWLQVVQLRLTRDPRRRIAVFKKLDRCLSELLLQHIKRSGADLCVYSGYARECFEAQEAAQRRKILFVFHPLGGLAGEILAADYARYPDMKWSHQIHVQEMEASDLVRVDAEITAATEVLCASSFTRTSIERAHAGKRISVVPYGCAPIARPSKDPVGSRKLRVLYVGQGVQRKGPHHLLRAWRCIGREAELLMVMNKVDPEVLCLLGKTNGDIRTRHSVPRDELNRLFEWADIFVMPSLIEGFGLVYLEALAAGCHVVGTENTGLPDLFAPPWAVTITPAGDIPRLVAALNRAFELVRSPTFSFNDICAFASTRSWELFRARVRAAIGCARSEHGGGT